MLSVIDITILSANTRNYKVIHIYEHVLECSIIV